MKGPILRMAILCGALAATAICPAAAESWDSAIYTGLTSVSWSLEGDTFVWTLANESGRGMDVYDDYDILVWSVTPCRVREPLSWTAPEGWDWDGRRMKLAAESGKYYSPYAIGPGQSLTFTYRPDPDGKYVNTSGPQDSGMLFTVHVGAVVPYSGTLDGLDRWEEYRVRSLGASWHDIPGVGVGLAGTVIPEPSAFLGLGFGVLALASMVARRLPSH
ncbi:MAG: hypothetical protein KBC96_14885 [Armatimonadetes bacterium]|nr:hypothetical protein [Armatimonadota bacterium]